MTLASNPSQTKQAEVKALLSLLAEGREAAFDGHALMLMHEFASAIGSAPTPISQRGRTLRFTLTRPELALRGFGGDAVHALILADGGSDWARLEPTFWQKVENTTEMPFLLSCGEEAYRRATERVAGHFALVFAPGEVVELLSSPTPAETLKSLARRRFKPSVLHPFDHQHPVEDAFFLGRRAILKRLRDNPDANYALVGPSKIGKTSLVKRLMRTAAMDSGKSGRQVYVDLFDRPTTDVALARAIRMGIRPSMDSYHEPLDSFQDFIAKAKSRLGGALEIVLDETDRHLHLPAMRTLIHLAAKRMCRLILIGRWRLMKYTVHASDDNFNRLELAVVPPMSLDESLDLIERPMRDLGFDVEPYRHDLRHAVNRVGRVPGLIQELGAFTVSEIPRVSLKEALRCALSRVVSQSRFIGLLLDLSSDESRATALLLGLQSEKAGLTEPMWLKDQFRKNGIRIGVAKCTEIFDELVIHHLLGYESNGSYRMARWDVVADSRIHRPRFQAMLDEYLDAARIKSPLA